VSVELVLRFIGGILAGVLAAEAGSGLLEGAEPGLSVGALVVSLAILAFAVGFAITPYLTTVPFHWFRERVLHASGTDFLVGGAGLIAGLVCGALLQPPLSVLPGSLGQWLPTVASVLFAYFGVLATTHHKRAVLALFGGVRESVRGPMSTGSEHVLVDTSAIIDGRLAVVAQTGFLFCTLVVPRFVLAELQQVADSTDASRRERGRRGLDTLDQLQKHSLAPVEIADLDDDPSLDVDTKLVRLARAHDWPLLTNDYNLNKVATLQGIRVLNLNELANALRPMYIPGQALRLHVIDKGQQAGQGVGYLPDGTMVVVEGGSRLLGEECEVVITRLLQSPAGRMYFARPKERTNGDGQ
jgi:uncharacterized protein YacL